LIGALTKLYQALVCVIEENGLPGVLEVLLRRFKMVEGNINLERKRGKMMKRVQGRKGQVERGAFFIWLPKTAEEAFIYN
jgi:hypothetical protein